MNSCRSRHHLVVLGAVLGEGVEDAKVIQDQLLGLGGLGTLATGIAIKAGLAAKKARKQKEPPAKGSGSKTPLGSVALFPPREEVFLSN